MKLELKHLAPYLPYGIKVMNGYSREIHVIENGHDIDHVMYSYNKNLKHKILLRPLSDLTKEIEHNGEKFVPIERLSVKSKSLLLNKETIYPNASKGIDLMCYRDIQELFKWHFDVFGLIKNELAIDINMLNK